MKKWEKTCLTAGTIAAGALGAASWAVGKIAMDVALDRALPPAVMKKSGEMLPAEVAAAIESLEPAIRELEKEAHETVTITAWDGTKLVGHWFRREHARRTMIGVHGWRASWSRDFCASYRFWREHQCNILYIELRGQGSSGGAHMAFGLLEQFDCLDWIRWVNGTLGEALPVYLNGISMGAATVLMAAGLTLPANVRGVMADCGYTSPEAVWKYVIEKQLRLPYGVCRWAVKRACRKSWGWRRTALPRRRPCGGAKFPSSSSTAGTIPLFLWK